MNSGLSEVHPEAEIGCNVHIGPFTIIEAGVVVGQGTWIGSHVILMKGTKIGQYCQVFPGAVIGAIPQDLKFKDQETQVEIGDYTTIREHVTVHRATLQKTCIGNHVLLMAYAHVAHDCVIDHHCVISNDVHLAGHVHLAPFVVLGGKAAVHQFIHIGRHVMVGSGSIVRKDVPPFIKVAREPLKYCGINTIGLTRRGFSAAKIDELQAIYRVIFQKDLSVTAALAYIQTYACPSPEKDEILRFIRYSTKGIVKKVGTDS